MTKGIRIRAIAGLAAVATAILVPPAAAIEIPAELSDPDVWADGFRFQLDALERKMD